MHVRVSVSASSRDGSTFKVFATVSQILSGHLFFFWYKRLAFMPKEVVGGATDRSIHVYVRFIPLRKSHIGLPGLRPHLFCGLVPATSFLVGCKERTTGRSKEINVKVGVVCGGHETGREAQHRTAAHTPPVRSSTGARTPECTGAS